MRIQSIYVLMVGLLVTQWAVAAQPVIPEGYYSSSVQVRSMQRDLVNDLYTTVINYDQVYDAGGAVTWHPPTLYAITGYLDFTGQYWAPGEYWSFYLQDYSDLGVLGPIGPNGPLSTYGPIAGPGGLSLARNKRIKDIFVGRANRNCHWCKHLWREWYRPMVLNRGPKALPDTDGPDGPLGEAGPLNPFEVYNTMYHLEQAAAADNFPQNLDSVGVWGVLGPLSHLGGLGALGALGPNGLRILRGYTIDADGNYRDDNNQVVRTFPMQYSNDGTYRVYRMYEMYSESYASSLAENNDASFAVQGTLTLSPKSFLFTSLHNQTVSALALPNSSAPISAGNFMDLDLKVEKRVNGAFEQVVLADSTSSTSIPIDPANANGYIDWAIFQANAGDVYRVTVIPKTSNASNNVYRLYVTGTGFLQGPQGAEVDMNVFDHLNITGPYQGNYCVDNPALCQ